MSDRFTEEAAEFWNSISEDIQEKVLNNVFCSNCFITTIERYKGKMENGDLVLMGICSKCGKDVGRVIEGR